MLRYTLAVRKYALATRARCTLHTTTSTAWAFYHNASKAEVEKAIAVALEARKKWAALAWEERAAIFLKAADLIAGPYRAKMNAATMIAQSKTVHQAEIRFCLRADRLFAFQRGIYG